MVSKGLFLFLLLLTHAPLFTRLRRLKLDVSGHAAGSEPPFGVRKGKGPAEFAAILIDNSFTAIALFHYGATIHTDAAVHYITS